MLSISRSPQALASPTLREAFAHTQTLHPISPLSFQGGLIPSPMHSPYGTGLDILPTPPLRVPVFSLLIPSTSAYLTTKQQSYFPLNANFAGKPAAPLLQSCLKSRNPDPDSKLDSPRVGKVRRWGQSITIDYTPSVIPDAGTKESQTLQVGEYERPALMTVAGRVQTPYHEKSEYMERCSCDYGRPCLFHLYGDN